MRLIDLPPGEYYVQAIYNYWLVAHWVNAPNSGERRPTDGTADEPRPILGFSKAQMDEPMAISEAIKLVVNAKAATPAKAVPLPDSPLRLDLGPPVWRAAPNDQWADVKFRLTNPTSETITVFNPGIDSRLFFNKQALNLIVINADEKQVGNYTDHNWGTSRTPRRNNWVRFSPGATISSQLEFQPRTIPLTEYDLGRNKLPPGKYFLELRGRRSLLTPPPAILNETDDFAIVREHSTYQTWWRGFPGPEICRSNRVELEILPRTGD